MNAIGLFFHRCRRQMARQARSIHVCPLALIMTMAAAASAEPTAESIKLRDIFHQFQTVSSIHCKADVQVLISRAAPDDLPDMHGVVGVPVMGEIEYWAAGTRYRFASRLEAGKLSGLNNEVAYDGQRFEILLGVQNTLLFSATDKPAILPMLPNPLLELVQFRYPITEDNFGTHIRMKEIRNDQVPDAIWNVAWTNALPDQSGTCGPVKKAEFPGGVFEGSAYLHHVYCAPEDENRPARIDRITVGGRRLTSTEFTQYEALGAPPPE